jgi:alpha-amylase/alpha-mannosidase (GH57 family)
MNRYICIHGHFYQPPRENPWLEEVELQDSAFPYHDWNERVTAECYAPNTASRIVDSENRILNLVNNYSKISFDIGPTLCAWMERRRPEVLNAIIEADKMSKSQFSGHGSAIAQVYNHMIMPLANRQDKYTQAYWGIMDFEKRFGRFPEGMWLPETAVDLETLEVLAELKIKFTILAPRQARRIRNLQSDSEWVDVGERIDPTMAYRCSLPSGKSIAVFFYNGLISQEMAFGDLLENGERFAQRLVGSFTDSRSWPQLVHVATDGESYGHHRRHGDMALAYCLHHIESTQQARLTNYAEYLEQHPPTHAVEIVENSSWSCVHGVERWRDDCGCNFGHAGWIQAWRKPLREAMDSLRDALLSLYEAEAPKYVSDPWRLRNEYYEIIHDRSRENVKRVLKRHTIRELSQEETVRALKLLEMQRDCMLMYTSCGWFFDEISGIETTQVLQYAAKAIREAEALSGQSFESAFTDKLALAPSNVLRDGAAVYDRYVRPASVDLVRVGAHYGITSLFTEPQQVTRLYCYTVESDAYKSLASGRFRAALGKVRIESMLTWEDCTITFAVLHLGDHNVNGGVRVFIGDEAFASMQDELTKAFERGDLTEFVRLMLKYFGSNNYTLWHLFRDEQRQILQDVLRETLDSVNRSLRTIYEDNSAVMAFLQGLQHPIPALLIIPSGLVISEQLVRLFDDPKVDIEKLRALAQQARKFSLKLHVEELEFIVGRWITARIEMLNAHPLDLQLLEELEQSLEALADLHLALDLWKAQNIYFAVAETLYPNQEQKANAGDGSAQRWITLFSQLGAHLHVRVR